MVPPETVPAKAWVPGQPPIDHGGRHVFKLGEQTVDLSFELWGFFNIFRGSAGRGL